MEIWDKIHRQKPMIIGTSEKSVTNSRFPKMHGDNYMYVDLKQFWLITGGHTTNSVCKERGGWRRIKYLFHSLQDDSDEGGTGL